MTDAQEGSPLPKQVSIASSSVTAPGRRAIQASLEGKSALDSLLGSPARVLPTVPNHRCFLQALLSQTFPPVLYRRCTNGCGRGWEALLLLTPPRLDMQQVEHPTRCSARAQLKSWEASLAE